MYCTRKRYAIEDADILTYELKNKVENPNRGLTVIVTLTKFRIFQIATHILFHEKIIFPLEKYKRYCTYTTGNSDLKQTQRRSTMTTNATILSTKSKIFYSDYKVSSVHLHKRLQMACGALWRKNQSTEKKHRNSLLIGHALVRRKRQAATPASRVRLPSD